MDDQQLQRDQTAEMLRKVSDAKGWPLLYTATVAIAGSEKDYIDITDFELRQGLYRLMGVRGV